MKTITIIIEADIQEELTVITSITEQEQESRLTITLGWGHNDAYAPGQGSDAT